MNWPYQFWETVIIPECALVWSSCLKLYSRLQSPAWPHCLALHLCLCPHHILCIPASRGCSMVRLFPSFILPRSWCSECAVYLLRFNTLAWLFLFHADSSYSHPHLGISVWRSSDVPWSPPPRKLSSERRPLALLYQPGTLEVKFLVGGVAETGAHIVLPGCCLLWPCTCWLFALEGQEGRDFSSKDWQWVGRHMKDCQSLQSLTLPGLLTGVSCADRVHEFVFTWEVHWRRWLPPKKSYF